MTQSTESSAQRLSIPDVDQSAYEGIFGMERYVRSGDLDTGLLHLVRIRASQLNGCAFCLDMHNEEARADGESQRRLDVLAGWHEARSLFTEREQAALELTEAVTRIGEAGVPDALWERVSAVFSDEQKVRLLVAIAAINVWNRLAVSTRQELPERA